MTHPTLPYDLTAERATIGAVLLDPMCADTLMDILPTPEAFYLERHGAIWRAIAACVAQRQPPDLITVSARLREQAGDKPIGLDALDSCLAEAADPGRAAYYAAIVADTASRRRIIDAGARVTMIGYDTSRSVVEAQDAAAAEVLALGDSISNSGFVSLSVAARRRADDYMQAMNGDNLAGIPTPWADLNRIVGGLKPGAMIVIGARPSMGKSAMAAGLVEHVSGRLGMHVGLISMEMSADEWVDRFVSEQGRVPLHQVVNGHADSVTGPAMLSGVGKIERWPVSIDDTPSQSITQIRARARRLHARQPLDLLVIDYLQLCAYGDPNENVALTTISRGIKSLARELKIPVVALSQLSRDLERRQDKRPLMSDLRGSGGIEQDADMILFIYRDEKYNANTDQRGIAEIIVAKHRNGPTGMARLAFSDDHATFRDLAPAYRDIRDYQSRGRHAAD